LNHVFYAPPNIFYADSVCSVCGVSHVWLEAQQHHSTGFTNPIESSAELEGLINKNKKLLGKMPNLLFKRQELATTLDNKEQQASYVKSLPKLHSSFSRNCYDCHNLGQLNSTYGGFIINNPTTPPGIFTI
jgi:hypothetical protein